MNKGQKTLTGIALIVFVAIGLKLINSHDQAVLIGFVVLLVGLYRHDVHAQKSLTK